MAQFLVGLDVGSTTVKAIVVDAATDAMLWQDYQRHETRQPEKVLEFLRRMEADTGISPAEYAHLCDWFGWRHHRRDDRREVRAGGSCRLARG